MYGNVISCDCHSMPCSFVIIGSGNSLNIAVKCQSTNAMRFFCNFSHKHIPSTPLRGQPRSPSIPHAAASSARVMQTRPHPRAATLSASFRDEVLSAPHAPSRRTRRRHENARAAAEAAAHACDAGDAPTSTQAGASSARTRTLLRRGRAAAAFSFVINSNLCNGIGQQSGACNTRPCTEVHLFRAFSGKAYFNFCCWPKGQLCVKGIKKVVVLL